MNYERIYFSIIENRKINKFDGYTENHHIKPRSLGGTDDKDNIVSLSAREHYICHLLLTEIYKNDKYSYSKMLHAFMMMCNMRSNNQKRDYKFNSKTYSRLKTEHSISMSLSQKGEKNSNYGTRWISNLHERITKKISVNTEIHDGWNVGRIVNFEYLDRTCEMCGLHLNCKSHRETKRLCELCRKENTVKNLVKITSKKCVCEGEEFTSLSEASKKLNLTVQLIRYRMTSKNFESYYYL